MNTDGWPSAENDRVRRAAPGRHSIVRNRPALRLSHLQTAHLKGCRVFRMLLWGLAFVPLIYPEPVYAAAQIVAHWDFSDQKHLGKETLGTHHGVVEGAAPVINERNGLNALQFARPSASMLVKDSEALRFDVGDAFSITAWIRLDDPGVAPMVILTKSESHHLGSKAIQLIVSDERVNFQLVHTLSSLINVATGDRLPLRQWLHVAVSYDGSGKAGGVRFWIDGQRVNTEVLHDSLTDTVASSGDVVIGTRYVDEWRHYCQYIGALGNLTIWKGTLTDQQVVLSYRTSTLHILSEPTGFIAIGIFACLLLLAGACRGVRRFYWNGGTTQ